MNTHPLLANLNLLKEHIWTTNLSDTDFEACKKMAAEVSSELEVYQALAATAKWLCETNTEKEGYKKLCAAHRNRITNVLKEVHSDRPGSMLDSRHSGNLMSKHLCLSEHHALC